VRRDDLIGVCAQPPEPAARRNTLTLETPNRFMPHLNPCSRTLPWASHILLSQGVSARPLKTSSTVPLRFGRAKWSVVSFERRLLSRAFRQAISKRRPIITGHRTVPFIRGPVGVVITPAANVADQGDETWPINGGIIGQKPFAEQVAHLKRQPQQQ